MAYPYNLSNSLHASNLIDRGNVQINVFNQNKSTPLSNAKVKVFSNVTGEQIDELYTDQSGKTPTIDLSTPPIEFSLTPEETYIPYSKYNIEVESTDFEPINIYGVQLLSDSNAIQDVYLTPKIGVNELEYIQIYDHTLWGNYPPKIPEAEIKPMPTTTGFVVLSEPVIPELVIVHLGLPANNTAENVWVNFKDYIKNVASSEIYPTWPNETIRANIHAILSFTLNRVFTEWYMGKGYNFTITNSTAFDQSFVKGRNVFQEISTVVDEIFTTYVSKPNVTQPLFTQYCDGVRAQCPKGLSQWGSKDLGDKGLDSLSILRNYYGSDVYISEATKVDGVPRSYPGYPLEIGATGENVRMIQEQLNRISNNYPAIPKIRVDSIYGEQTKKAVEEFQKIFNLQVNGIVDFKTWYSISNIFVAVTNMS